MFRSTRAQGRFQTGVEQFSALRELMPSLVYVLALLLCCYFLAAFARAQDRARIVFDCPDDSGVFFWGSRRVDNGPSRYPVYEELSGMAASERGFPPAKVHSRYGRQGAHYLPAAR